MEPGRPLEKQKGKRQNEKLLLWLFSFSVLKIHTTQNENTVRLFRLINYNSYHLIKKSLCGFQNCREQRKESVPQSLTKVTDKIKAYEKMAEHDYSKLSYILYHHREQRPYL